MYGLNWDFEYLCEYASVRSQHSSSPLSAADVNPLIKRFLERYPGSSVFGFGGHSAVLSINDGVMAKISLREGDAHLIDEQAIFAELDQTPCPYIVQTFLCRPNIIFMEPLRNGSLYNRMSRASSNGTRWLPSEPLALSWMQRIVTAVACLESHGYAHSDINPRNILFDHEDQPKLVDLDHAVKIGEDLDVGEEPYVRLNTQRFGGVYGPAGSITEQLALGSVFWYMTRGKELYDDIPGPDQVDRLMKGEFPPMSTLDRIDSIINDCWLSKFDTIAHLSRRIQVVTNEMYDAKKAECEGLYQQLLEDDVVKPLEEK